MLNFKRRKDRNHPRDLVDTERRNLTKSTSSKKLLRSFANLPKEVAATYQLTLEVRPSKIHYMTHRVRDRGFIRKTESPKRDKPRSTLKLQKLKRLKKYSREPSHSKSFSQENKPQLNLKSKINFASQLGCCINLSNGVKILKESRNLYTYYLPKGNNSPVVRECFNSRWWWSHVKEDEMLSANLLWTQTTKKPFVELIECLDYKPQKLTSESLEFNFASESLVKSDLGFESILNNPNFVKLELNNAVMPNKLKVHNKLEFHNCLSDKKYLYRSMKAYYEAKSLKVFNYLPVTFHIVNGQNDPSFEKFESFYNKLSQKNQKNIWILKPGENTNRGNGIRLCNNISQITEELKNNPFPRTGAHSFIIQKYIHNPFLISKRKFDIRCFALVTVVNNVTQAYFYEEGYLRTASKKYNPNRINNKFVHLTNDAVQKKSEDYGKYEPGNKLSYGDFQKYLNSKGLQVDFLSEILPKMREAVKDTIEATYDKLNRRNRGFSFEIFGYDFMLDTKLKPWLIEVNTNPCLETSCSILARIISSMLENAFQIAIDPLFPQPLCTPKNQNTRKQQTPYNKFTLVFHELSNT